MGDRRDQNLVKASVALVLVGAGFGWVVVRVVRLAGLDESAALAGLGAVCLAYALVRVALASGAWRRRPSEAEEVAYLRTACGGAALVTGCTAGLGRAFAHGLARRRCSLVLVSRDPAKLRALAEELRERYIVEVTTCAFDFDGSKEEDEHHHHHRGTAAASREKFYEVDLRQLLEGVGLVVNNVGVGSEDPLTIDETPASDVEAMLAVNCGATTRMCRTALPVLAARHIRGAAGLQLPGGVVVNVASGSALQPTPYLAVYAATKAFIAHLSQSLDQEWRGRKVRVLCIAPYYVAATGLFKGKASFNAPAPEAVVDGTLATLVRPSQTRVGLTTTNPAHALIHALVATIAEDPALSFCLAPLARLMGLNASMLQIMTKARARFLARRTTT